MLWIFLIKYKFIMKILSIGTDRKLFEDGSAVLGRALLYSSLVEEMHIIVSTTKGHNFSDKKIGNLYIYPTNSSSRFLYIKDIYKIGKKIIRENNFVRGLSVITTQDPFENGFAGYLLSNKFKLPLYLQSHTDFLIPSFKKGFLNKIRLMFANFVIPKASGMRVVSQNVKESIINKFTKLPFIPDVLPIYIDIEKIENHIVNENVKNTLQKFKFVVCMVSRITKEKGIDLAIKALEPLFKKYFFMGLVLVGDGDQRDSIVSLTKKMDLEDRVIFAGWQSDVYSYMKSSQVFLNTSYYEGYGMTIIEAGASKTAIVTTQVGIAKEICKDKINSLVCPIGDVECIRNSIEQLISDNQSRILYSNNMLETVKNISGKKEDYVKTYINNLGKILK